MSENKVIVRLSDGREIEIRKPMMGEMHRIDMLSVAQMNVTTCAEVLARVGALSKEEFNALDFEDGMRVVAGLASFFPRDVMEMPQQ